MLKKMSDKQLASVIIIIVMLFLVLSYCVFNRTGSVHFYSVIVSDTSESKPSENHCVAYDGKVYYYSDSISKKGLCMISGENEEMLLKTDKIYSMTICNNIIAFMTDDSIYFYDCDLSSVESVSEKDLLNKIDFIDLDVSFSDDQDFLYSDNGNIYLCDNDFAFCVYPSVSSEKVKYTSEVKIEQYGENLNMPNPNSPKESVSLKRPEKSNYYGVVKPYNNKSVCLIYDRSSVNLSLGDIDSRVIIADFDTKSAEYVFTAGDKQQVVYANDRKCVYYDYNEKGFFSYDYASGESKLLQKCRLMNFMTYYIESADDNTLVVYNRFLRLNSIIHVD